MSDGLNETLKRAIENDDVVVIQTKKIKRGAVELIPPNDGTLTITVHIISVNSAASSFSKTKRNISFEVPNSARFLSNFDIEDPYKNLEHPSISATMVHEMVINYFGETASNFLEKVKSGDEPRLLNKAQNTTNPEYSVSYNPGIATVCAIFSFYFSYFRLIFPVLYFGSHVLGEEVKYKCCIY